MFQLFKNLFLHGEGEGDGAAPGAEAPGAEATTGVQSPDAGEKNRRLTKAERRAQLEQKLQAEAQAQQPQQPQQQPARAPWEEIKKQYKDEYGKDVQTAIQGRFKNQADNEAELASIKETLAKREALLTRLAKDKYGMKADDKGAIDYDAFEKTVDDDDELYEERAAERGWSTDTEKYVSGLERKAEELKQMQEQQRQAAEKEAMEREQYARFQQHKAQAEAFAQKVPGFDLVKEMQASPEFARLLSYGVNVESAFYAIHHEELMAVGQQAAAQQAQQALASRIQAGQSMPMEGGLSKAPAANPQRTVNPKNMTREERRALNKRAMRGEYISW